jgi:hypothetical protein
MKKGFILALLVVAMVALVLPVSGRAPIIKSLPVIIIGDLDTGNFDSGSNKGIMRFAGALDLQKTTTVDWNNDESYTSDSFHAYLFQVTAPAGATTVKPYVAGRIVDTLMTNEELADVLNGQDTPSTTTDIMSWTMDPAETNWLVNLFDAGRHPSITNPAGADPATQGETPDAGYTKEVAMRLVCGVTSGTVLAASDANLTVRCQSNDNNERVQNFTPVEDYTFTGSVEGWTWTTAGAAAYNPVPVQTTAGSGTTGIGFIQATPVVMGEDVNHNLYCAYAGWFSPLTLPCENAELNTVYRASASLESTSASPATALGYRLRYHNRGFAHQGFIRFQSAAEPPAGDVLNTPTAGNPLTVKAFWAARPDLGDQADDGASATVYPAGDQRNYRVCFEMLGFTGEQGTLTLESISIDRLARPAAVEPEVAWGSGTDAIPFDTGFAQDNGLPATTGWTAGTATMGATNMVLTLGGTGNRYLGRKPNGASGFGDQVKPVSNHLYRFSVTIACASREAVPCYRTVVNSLMRVGSSTSNVQRSISWIDWFAFNDTTGAGTKQAGYRPDTMAACPFAPATGGSVIDTYVFSQNVADASTATTVFLPILDVVDKGLFATSTEWPDAITPMTYSAASWEDLGADY